MRYLVAGGCGFIGVNLCRRILAKGKQIVCLDNMCTGSPRNLAELDEVPGFTHMAVDISTLEPSGGGLYSHIINLACPASPPKYYAMPQATARVNSIGVQNLLDLARLNDARIVQSSTSEVYGDPLYSPQDEECPTNILPYGKRPIYDSSKILAETLFWWARHSDQATGNYPGRCEEPVNTGVVRIFNTYGPGMDPFDGRVVSTFIRQALAGQELTIHGDGRHTRSFCYIDDLVDVLMLMIDSDIEGPVNIGNPGEFTIGQLAEIVNRLTGNTAGIVFEPDDVADPKQRCPNINRAKAELGWGGPQVQLEEGICRTIDWFKSIDY